MPKAFEDCQAKGGKIRTMKLSGGRYMRICIHKGRSVRGEIKHKQKDK